MRSPFSSAPLTGVIAALATLLATGTQSQAATFIGAEVIASREGPQLGTPAGGYTFSPAAFVVGSGPESAVSTAGTPLASIDFGDSGLQITFLTGNQFGVGPFNGYVFKSDAFTGVSGVTLDPLHTLSALTLDRISVVGDELQLNLSGLSHGRGAVVALDFQFTAVPEPGTWALMIVGAGLAGASLRRRPRGLAA